MSRTGPGVGSGAASTSAAASSGTPRTRQTNVQDSPNAPAAKSTSTGGPSVLKTSEIRKSPSSTRTGVKRAAETTATTTIAGKSKAVEPTVTAPAEPTATDACSGSTDLGMDLDVEEEPVAAAMTVPPAADPLPAASADSTPVPSKSSARLKSTAAARPPAAPGSSTQTTSPAHPESRAKPPPAMRKSSQSAASAAAAAVIAAWNARFSPQVDDAFFSPNARSATAPRSTSPPPGVPPSPVAADRPRSSGEGAALGGTVFPPKVTPTSAAVHGAADVPSPPETPDASAPPPVPVANRAATPTPESNIPAVPVTSPPPPPQVAATHHHRAAPIGPKKRFSSMMQPVIHDLSSKSRTRYGVPERMGGGSGRAPAVSGRMEGRLDVVGVVEREGDVQAIASGNGKVMRNESVAGPSTAGKAKDPRPNGMAEPVALSSKRKELRGSASTMPEKDTDSADRQESRRKDSRRVRMRSPSPLGRRKPTERPVDIPRSPSPAAEDCRTPPRSRRSATRPSESPAKRTRDVDPYAEELRVDPASDEDYAPPSARKEARGATGREEESPAKRRKDVPRREAKGGVSAVSGPKEPVSVQERSSRRSRGRADVDQDMEEPGTTLTADQDPPPSTREPSRQKEKRVAETSVRRKDADPAPEEPESRSTSDAQPTSLSSRSKAALLSTSAPERTESDRSKESRRPALVARSRAMRMEAEQETSSRTRPSAQKSRDEVTSVVPEREEVPQRSGSRPSATLPPAPSQQESLPVSPPKPIADVYPASQSPATQSQRTQLPPPPTQRSANANFQDYLRRSQIGKKGGGPSRQPPVVEKRKRVEEAQEVVLPREVTPPQRASPPLEVSPLREASAPQDASPPREASPLREANGSREGIARQAPEKPSDEPESTDDWIMEIDTEPVLPSPRLPTPPPISEPLPPPPPLVKEKTKSTLARTSGSTKPKEPLSKAALLAEKQAQIEKLLDEHDTVLREMFHLEKFKTMVIGYDPRIAKQETSNVWKEVSPVT